MDLNVFIAGTLVAVVAAIVGYFVVLRAQAFAAHALSHVGFAGATLAAFVGFNSLLGVALFTVAAALGIGGLGKKIQGRDVEIGMILSFALGLGVLFLKLYSDSASETVEVLFGSLASVAPGTIMTMIILDGVVLLALAALFRPLLFSSIDPEVAEARGVPVRFLSIAFLLLLALAVTEAIQVVGILLVFALMVAPPAAAQHLTRRPRTAIGVSVVLAVAFTWIGIWLAVMTEHPASFYIATLAAATYFVAVGMSYRMRPHIFSSHEHHAHDGLHPEKT